MNITLATDGQICIILNEFAMNAVRHGRQENGRVVVTIEGFVARMVDCSSLCVTTGVVCQVASDSMATVDVMILASALDTLKGPIRRINGKGAPSRFACRTTEWPSGSYPSAGIPNNRTYIRFYDAIPDRFTLKARLVEDQDLSRVARISFFPSRM